MLRRVPVPLRIVFALACLLGASACPPMAPSASFDGLTYSDLALGQTVRVSVRLEDVDGTATFSTLDPEVLGVAQVGPRQGNTYDLDLAARSPGETSLIIEVDGNTFTRDLGVAAAVAIDLRPFEGFEGRAALPWAEQTKVATGRSYWFSIALRAADGRLLQAAEPITVVESAQVEWVRGNLLYDQERVVVTMPVLGEVVVALDAGDAAPPTSYRLIGVDPELIVGLVLQPDLGAPPCVTALGLDAEGDTVVGVAFEWLEGGVSAGTGDRACYFYGEDELVIGARLQVEDAAETTTVRGYGLRARPTGT